MSVRPPSGQPGRYYCARSLGSTHLLHSRANTAESRAADSRERESVRLSSQQQQRCQSRAKKSLPLLEFIRYPSEYRIGAVPLCCDSCSTAERGMCCYLPRVGTEVGISRYLPLVCSRYRRATVPTVPT